MRAHNCICLVLACFLVACSSVAAPTATPTQPKPTSTFTPSSTDTPAPTQAPQPTSTPLGGSSGKILFLSDSTLYTSNIDGSDKEVVIPKTRLMEILAVERDSFLNSEIISSTWISPNGENVLIWICILINQAPCVGGNPTRFLLVSTDLSLAKTITEVSDEVAFGIPLWSYDGERVILQVFDIAGPGQIGISPREGYRTFIIETNEGRFGEVAQFGRASTAFWSSDGQTIYYFGVFELEFSKADGSGKQVCETCSKWESVVYAGATSPDGKRVAVLDTLKKLTIASSDFSNTVEFALSLTDYSVLPEFIQWSPDGQKLAIKVSTDGGAKHTIIVMDPNTGKQRELVVSQSNQSITLCGWSPDSKGLLYVQYNVETMVIELVFVDIMKNTERRLPYSDHSCPVWL